MTLLEVAIEGMEVQATMDMEKFLPECEVFDAANNMDCFQQRMY